MSRKIRDGWFRTAIGGYIMDGAEASATVYPSGGGFVWSVRVRKGHVLIKQGSTSGRASAMKSAEGSLR